ncbi:peroxiredoxin family protein [Marinirhabdus gelatinilytica]|uniref:Peroxiredoxin n=1 Tax=Marinirhabdus gelatinilytica TaxID=1703343 RepID=A0A370QAN3_9FLAO|nr:TlpA disulfide reductase family protein [Marinirhabdus gelatinilytica]RDK85431.1 peroxiredoxin [Marinirhabdus gelatinilytica]
MFQHSFYKNLLFASIVVLLFSCNRKLDKPKQGEWRATMETMDGKQLPFLFTFTEGLTMTVSNATEEVIFDDVTLREDSIIIAHPIYEGVFKGVFTPDSITGLFIKPSLNREMPFVMKQGRKERFAVSAAPKATVTGNWETVFSPNKPADRYIAKGIFEQKGHKVTGTFRTTTGDYRYLDGAVENDTLRLSTFDGAHAFLFEAKVQGDSLMAGVFYSGNHWKEPFTARKNDAYELPRADSLTFLRDGYEKLEFTFPNTKGKEISLSDNRFKDKVVIVQVMGTWCPNCLDETRYLTEYYNDTKNENLEIVALAFEYAPTKEKAMAAIYRLKEKVGVPYPMLLAQYGSSDKGKANQKLPMLNHVLSYPTTIFIDKAGNVRKIHTGFNGPATGKNYDAFVKEFERYVEMLLEEDLSGTTSESEE